LGRDCEIIADFSPGSDYEDWPDKDDDGYQPDFAAKHTIKTLLSMLKRRPCSLDDICTGMNIARNEALKYVTVLQNEGVVDMEEIAGKVFFKVVS
jgi:hypothetical protein